MHYRALPVAAAAIGLGLTGMIFGDFALQWQPVPDGVPERVLLARVSAGLLIAAGGSMLFQPTAARGALLLGCLLLGWVVALHAPRVAAAPGDVAAWLGLAEILALASGALALAAWEHGAGNRVLTLRAIFGLCPLVFGLSHFAYAEFTASMVPDWIPAPLFWAYLTGIAHLAAGAAFLTGRIVRVAAGLLATMCGVFVLVLHLPRVAARPGSHIEWVMLCVAIGLAGAAFVFSRRSPSRDTPGPTFEALAGEGAEQNT